MRLRATLGICSLLTLLAVQAAAAGTGPFRYRHVGHIGGVVTPYGLAIDQQCGDVYISDTVAKVVHHFDQFGKLINNIGTAGSEVRGGLVDPRGMFLEQLVAAPLNPLGPPLPCVGSGRLWVTDYSSARINVFDPGGAVKSVWCGKQFAAGVCDLTGLTTYDYYPNDVWVSGDRVWVAGHLSESIREYSASGVFARSVKTNDGASVAQWGGNLWATHGGNGSSVLALYSAAAGAATDIPLIKLFPWSLNGPSEDVRAIWTGLDGSVYLIDRRGLEVYSPTGVPGSITPLSTLLRATDVAVRYDGMVYVSGVFTKGAEIYSPGATVTLKRLAGKRGEVVLSGSVVPAHPRNQIVIQRLSGTTWQTLAKVRLDAHSKFVYHWKTAASSYQVRLFFHDPHRYHADRASAILSVG